MAAIDQRGDDLTGELLGGRYRLLRRIGRGGMGVVYEGRSVDLGRRVAVKVLHSGFASDQQQLVRLRREAESAAALGHPNIVQVTDCQSEPGQPPFIVMEMLDGTPLSRLVDRPLDPERVAMLSAQVLSALEAAHGAGIVHRDIKPGNIFVLPLSGPFELVKVIDFGVAKLRESESFQKLTATGVVVGTPRYMSPEQARGDAVDSRSDLYSLGVVMYHALSGTLPFDGNTFGRLAVQINREEPPSLAERRPGLPPALLAVVERALKKDPADRFPTARDMQAAIAPLTRGALRRSHTPAATPVGGDDTLVDPPVRERPPSERPTGHYRRRNGD